MPDAKAVWLDHTVSQFWYDNNSSIKFFQLYVLIKYIACLETKCFIYPEYAQTFQVYTQRSWFVLPL